jgi:hypothetical protein
MKDDRPTVTLAKWEVPQLAEITIVEGAPLPAGQSVAPPPRRPKRETPGVPSDQAVAVPVPIPVPKEEC